MDFQKEKEAYLGELLGRDVITQDEFRDLVFKPEINAFDSNYLSSRFIDKINFGWSAWQAKAQAVPELSELQERIAGHQYYHDEHGHMIVDMDDVVKEISGFDSWKAQAVPDTYTPIVLALEDVQSKIAQASFLTMDADNENEVYAVDANELHEYIAELIEAQESAND